MCVFEVLGVGFGKCQSNKMISVLSFCDVVFCVILLQRYITLAGSDKDKVTLMLLSPEDEKQYFAKVP